jgi:hypothetical protein
MSTSMKVYLEAGDKKTFACALEWPGLCRGGKTADDALASLIDHAPRYAAVPKGPVAFTPPTDAGGLEVVSRVKGGSGTDFGVPSRELPADREPLSEAELRRQIKILDASWAAFDAAAKAAKGIELRKGPRGGGRDLDKIVGHVHEADEAYCHQLGARRPKPVAGESQAAASKRLRETMRAALTARARGEPIADPNKVHKPWSARYAVRRSAWHALDHAWEIEDRSSPDPSETT